jgi:hydrogenase maturation protein HypF
MLVRSDLSWERLGHLGYLPLARAGDEVADPSVVASAYMDALGLGRDAGCVRRSASGVLTSSLGRLFDAVAGITGVLRRASFDAEAAIALEAAAVPRERGHYFSPDLIDVHSSPARILPKPIIASVSREALAGVPAGLVSARFHNTLVRAASFLAVHLARQHGLTTVCLSGGSFQNTLIRAGVCRSLLTKGLRPLLNAHVPANDGGIALGQAIAANCRP